MRSQGHSYYTMLWHVYKYTRIYLLHTPWCKVLLEKLTGCHPVKTPAFYGTRRFINAFTSARRLSLYWASSIQSIPPHPTSWRSILISSSHLRLEVVSFPQVIPPKHMRIHVCINLYSEERNQRMSKLSPKCSVFLLRCIFLANYNNNSGIFLVTFEPNVFEIKIHTACTKRSLRIKNGKRTCFCSSNCGAQNKDKKTLILAIKYLPERYGWNTKPAYMTVTYYKTQP